MKKRRPGIEKAAAFIHSLIASKHYPNKLPPIRLLAKKADVSFVTMWKAAGLLKKEGVVSADNRINPSSGHKRHAVPAGYAESSDAVAALNEAENLFWHKVRNRIKKDILCGRYSSGQPFPSCKELTHTYGASFRTLKKSLDALASDGMIKPYNRGFIVPSMTFSESNVRVVALGCGWKDGKIWADYQDKNYFRLLESECIKSRIALDVVVYYRENGRLIFIHSATRKPYDFRNDDLLGFICIVANHEVDPDEVLSQISAIKKPVAVLDVVGYYKNSTVFQGNQHIRFFTATASAIPASIAARYLLNLKHARIAYLSPFHGAPWSKIRLRSVVSVYREAGVSDTVRPFVLDDYAYQWDYLKNAKNPEDLLTLINQYAQWKKYVHSNFFKKFGNISYSISKYLTEWNCASGEIYRRMRSLCEKALACGNITAWVMANDFAATLALDYLKEKGIRVPEDISIISFDNTMDAMEYQLTSYDFNINGMVTMMLRYVLTPSTVPAGQRGKFIEVEGSIVARRSTAPARK